MDARLVTVIGASGFVGRHVVRALARDGWRVRAACRRPDLAGHLQPMGRVGQIHAVQVNVRYPDSLRAVMEEAEVVVNLVAVLARQGQQSFQKLHVDGARAVASAAQEAGVKRLIHVSAIGADPASISDYARTKGEGEQAILGAFSDAMVLRPSLIFGPEDQLFNRFAGLLQMAPVVPMIGARTRFQPVYVGDVADAVAAACAGAGAEATTYELGGPEVMTMRQILERTMAWTGRERPLLPLPFWMARLLALLTWPLPNSVRPFTFDQVRLLGSDNIVSAEAVESGRTLAAFGITQPQSAAVVVPTYLERFRPRGQFSHYRS